MALIDIIKHAQSNPLLDEDGEPIALDLLPGMSPGAIDEFAAQLPCPLPDHVRSLLQFCQGLEGTAADLVDFTGAGMSYAQPDLFPHGIPIASDGYGNFWVVDLMPASTDWAPIYFACHDAPVILFQSASLEQFLTALLLTQDGEADVINDVHEDERFKVWRKNPGVQSHEACIQSPDPDIQAFARSLDPSFQFIDLRNPAIGFGFSWGRYGPDTVVRRHGTLPLFAYQRKGGLLRRLLGKSA